MTLFAHLQNIPPDAVFGLQATYKSDPRKEKINLAIGVYQDENGKTPTLECVRLAEKMILEENICKEYLPIEGFHSYLEQVGLLTFGKHLWKSHSSSVFLAQTIGGTGALRIAGDFLRQIGKTEIHVPKPTWANHHGIFKAAGLRVSDYFYFDYKSNHLKFDEFYESLAKLPNESVILLHGVCHNPTGIDPSLEEWKRLSELFLQKSFIAFFDLAYLGFGDGINDDRKSIEIFIEKGVHTFVACSFSKNFGLYGERVGALCIFATSKNEADTVGSHIRKIIRESYSNPPIHGVQIVEKVLKDQDLRNLWESEVNAMRNRANHMRKQLLDQLALSSIEINQNAKGLFYFLGLTKEKSQRLIDEEALYLSSDGRINVTGLNHSNIEIVLKKIQKALL